MAIAYLKRLLKNKIARFLAQRAELDLTHKSERMKHYADRVKAILALDAGWSFEEVVEILLYDAATIRRFHKSYIEGGIDGLVKDSYLKAVLNAECSSPGQGLYFDVLIPHFFSVVASDRGDEDLVDFGEELFVSMQPVAHGGSGN